MTILKRDTIVDRPELVNRDDEDEQNKDGAEGEKETSVIGEGGGLTVHGIEFEEGDERLIAAANTCAVLTTGRQSGDVFNQMFANASVQLKDMKSEGRDLDQLSFFGMENSIGTAGVGEKQEQAIVDSLISDSVEDADDSADNLEEVEDDVESIEEDGEEAS
jgi:hypothetical protein